MAWGGTQQGRGCDGSRPKTLGGGVPQGSEPGGSGRGLSLRRGEERASGPATATV